MVTDIKPTAPLRQKAKQELTEFVIIASYLYVCFFALTLLKVGILRGQGISYLPVGFALVKSLILAKFILIGHALHIGERNGSRPLIWPTIQKSGAFLALLCVLTIIEEVIVGAIHGLSISTSLAAFTGANLVETAARIVILMLVLIPYFAFRTLGDVLGEGTLVRLFFVERSTFEYSAASPDKVLPRSA